MPQQQEINLEQIPKQFAERAVIGSNNQFFVIVPIVGMNATAYALTPEHAKELSVSLANHVAKFEKDVRPILDGVPSPIQKPDLGSKK